MELKTASHMTDQLLLNSSVMNGNTFPIEKTMKDFHSFFQQLPSPWVNEVLLTLASSAGKRSFLVFRNNKYMNVPTENIAFFYIRYDSAMIMGFDKQEYFVNYSLDQIQNLVPGKQFYRLNRQYLINF